MQALYMHTHKYVCTHRHTLPDSYTHTHTKTHTRTTTYCLRNEFFLSFFFYLFVPSSFITLHHFDVCSLPHYPRLELSYHVMSAPLCSDCIIAFTVAITAIITFKIVIITLILIFLFWSSSPYSPQELIIIITKI